MIVTCPCSSCLLRLALEAAVNERAFPLALALADVLEVHVEDVTEHDGGPGRLRDAIAAAKAKHEGALS